MLPGFSFDGFADMPGALRPLAQPVIIALVGSWIALLLHELGHAVAAWLVGVRIWGIRLGVGPSLWRGRIGECRVDVSIFPFLGAVQLLDQDAHAIGYKDIVAGTWRFEWGPEAWRAPIISAGGGISNLLGVLALVSFWNRLGQPHLSTVTGSVLLVAMVSNLSGYLNLVPCFSSDGVHLLAHIRAARLRLQPAHA